MKKLSLVVTVFIVTALLFFGIDRVSAQSWDSYSDLDHLNHCDSFRLHCTICMCGKGFTQGQNYKIIYWDGQGYKRVAEVQKATGPQGELSSEHTFGPLDVGGDWHCTVYPAEYDPSSYNPADTNIVADDTLYTGGYDFNVAAITVIAAIGVAGLCFGIYYWMRRRYRRVEVSRN